MRKQIQGEGGVIDGYWARFCFVQFQITPSPPIKIEKPSTLPNLLHDLYERMGQISPTNKDRWEYKLDQQGIDLLNTWQKEIDQELLNEPSEILQATLPKAKERACRIALIIHLIEAVLEERDPEPIIPASTLQRAIDFTRWLQGQTRLVFAGMGETDSPESSRITRFLRRFGQCGEIKARQVQRWIGNKMLAQDARDFMAQVVGMGYATDNGKPTTDSGYAITITN